MSCLLPSVERVCDHARAEHVERLLPLILEAGALCRAVQHAGTTTEELPPQFQGAFEPAPSTPTRTRSPPRAAPSQPAPRGTREQGQKTKTLKDLCRSPDSGTGVKQPSADRPAAAKTAKRRVVAPLSDVLTTTEADMSDKRESSTDTAAEMAAQVLVAASKRRRSESKAASAMDQRRQDATQAKSPTVASTGKLLSSGNGSAAPLTAHFKRHRGSAGVKEVQLLASKVVVTPGQTRIRRSAADQAWWVVT